VQIDDPLDAIAVHAGCGIWGLLATAAFAAPGMVSDVYGARADNDEVKKRPASSVVPLLCTRLDCQPQFEFSLRLQRPKSSTFCL
jgi:ammonia channel protein AmtB